MIGPEHFRREVIFKAVRSRGPGGQNVNKVSSAAQINWDLEHSLLFTPEQKDRLRVKLAPLMTNEGYIQFRADEFRDLERNKQRCLEKLAELVRQSLFVQKKRKATKPTRSSQKKRVEQKSRRGEIKQLRRKIWD